MTDAAPRRLTTMLGSAGLALLLTLTAVGQPAEVPAPAASPALPKLQFFHVPEDRIAEFWPGDETRHYLTLDELRTLLREYAAQAAEAAPRVPTQIQLQAAWNPRLQRLEGTARLAIPAGGSELIALAPWSPVVTKLQAEIAARARPALWGTTSTGSLLVRLANPDAANTGDTIAVPIQPAASLTLSWHHAATYSDGRYLLELQAPACAVSNLALELPADWRCFANLTPISSAPTIATPGDRLDQPADTPPRPERPSADKPQTPDGQSAAVTALSYAFSGLTTLRLELIPPATQQRGTFAWTSEQRFRLDESNVELAAEFTLDALHERQTSVDLLLEDPMVPVSQTPATDWTRLPPANNEDGRTRWRVSFRQPARGLRRLAFRSTLPPVASGLWRAPTVEAIGGLERGVTVRLETAPSLRLARVDPGHFRAVAAQRASDGWYQLIFRNPPETQRTLSPALEITRGGVEAAARLASWLDLTGSTPTFSALCEWTARTAPLAQPRLLIPAGWRVAAVEGEPAEHLRQFFEEPRPGGGTRLVLDLARTLPVAESFRVRLRLRPADPTGETAGLLLPEIDLEETLPLGDLLYTVWLPSSQADLANGLPTAFSQSPGGFSPDPVIRALSAGGGGPTAGERPGGSSALPNSGPLAPGTLPSAGSNPSAGGEAFSAAPATVPTQVHSHTFRYRPPLAQVPLPQETTTNRLAAWHRQTWTRTETGWAAQWQADLSISGRPLSQLRLTTAVPILSPITWTAKQLQHHKITATSTGKVGSAVEPAVLLQFEPPLLGEVTLLGTWAVASAASSVPIWEVPEADVTRGTITIAAPVAAAIDIRSTGLVPVADPPDASAERDTAVGSMRDAFRDTLSRSPSGVFPVPGDLTPTPPLLPLPIWTTAYFRAPRGMLDVADFRRSAPPAPAVTTPAAVPSTEPAHPPAISSDKGTAPNQRTHPDERPMPTAHELAAGYGQAWLIVEPTGVRGVSRWEVLSDGRRAAEFALPASATLLAVTVAGQPTVLGRSDSDRLVLPPLPFGRHLVEISYRHPLAAGWLTAPLPLPALHVSGESPLTPFLVTVTDYTGAALRVDGGRVIGRYRYGEVPRPPSLSASMRARLAEAWRRAGEAADLARRLRALQAALAPVSVARVAPGGSAAAARVLLLDAEALMTGAGEDLVGGKQKALMTGGGESPAGGRQKAPASQWSAEKLAAPETRSLEDWLVEHRLQLVEAGPAVLVTARSLIAASSDDSEPAALADWLAALVPATDPTPRLFGQRFVPVEQMTAFADRLDQAMPPAPDLPRQTWMLVPHASGHVGDAALRLDLVSVGSRSLLGGLGLLLAVAGFAVVAFLVPAVRAGILGLALLVGLSLLLPAWADVFGWAAVAALVGLAFGRGLRLLLEVPNQLGLAAGLVLAVGIGAAGPAHAQPPTLNPAPSTPPGPLTPPNPNFPSLPMPMVLPPAPTPPPAGTGSAPPATAAAATPLVAAAAPARPSDPATLPILVPYDPAQPGRSADRAVIPDSLLRRLEQASEAAATTLIRQAEYIGDYDADNRGIRWRATYRLTTLARGLAPVWVTLPFQDIQPPTEVLVDGAMADFRPAASATARAALAIRLSNPADSADLTTSSTTPPAEDPPPPKPAAAPREHEISLEFFTPVLGVAPERRFQFTLPRATQSRFRLLLPGAVRPVLLAGELPWSFNPAATDTGALATQAELDAGSIGTVSAVWLETSPTPVAAVLDMDSVQLLDVGTQGSELAASVRWTPRSGARDFVELLLPASLELRRVDSAGLVDWTILPAAAPLSEPEAPLPPRPSGPPAASGERRLRLQFAAPLVEPTVVRLNCLVAAEPAPMLFPAIRPAEGEAEATLAVRLPERWTVELGSTEAARVRAVPPGDQGVAPIPPTGAAAPSLLPLEAAAAAARWPMLGQTAPTRLQLAAVARLTAAHPPAWPLRIVPPEPAVYATVTVDLEPAPRQLNTQVKVALNISQSTLPWIEIEVPTAFRVNQVSGVQVGQSFRQGRELLVFPATPPQENWEFTLTGVWASRGPTAPADPAASLRGDGHSFSLEGLVVRGAKQQMTRYQVAGREGWLTRVEDAVSIREAAPNAETGSGAAAGDTAAVFVSDSPAHRLVLTLSRDQTSAAAQAYVRVAGPPENLQVDGVWRVMLAPSQRFQVTLPRHAGPVVWTVDPEVRMTEAVEGDHQVWSFRWQEPEKVWRRPVLFRWQMRASDGSAALPAVSESAGGQRPLHFPMATATGISELWLVLEPESEPAVYLDPPRGWSAPPLPREGWLASALPEAASRRSYYRRTGTAARVLLAPIPAIAGPSATLVDGGLRLWRGDRLLGRQHWRVRAPVGLRAGLTLPPGTQLHRLSIDGVAVATEAPEFTLPLPTAATDRGHIHTIVALWSTTETAATTPLPQLTGPLAPLAENPLRLRVESAASVRPRLPDAPEIPPSAWIEASDPLLVPPSEQIVEFADFTPPAAVLWEPRGSARWPWTAVPWTRWLLAVAAAAAALWVPTSLWTDRPWLTAACLLLAWSLWSGTLWLALLAAAFLAVAQRASGPRLHRGANSTS